MWDSFRGRRGLRQGDPLSPLLFVLAMEYFSRIMHKASTLPNYKHHPHCKPLNLTHLMFADDLIIFGKADPPTIQIMKEALDHFSCSTGLVANLHKSQIFLGGCPTSLHNHCIQTIGFQEGSLPMNYLGIPITASRLSKLECSTLVEKITARVHIWATRNLSFAGRAMLINNVIFGMFNYWASIFLLPQSVLDKITSICRNYLWGGKEDMTRIPHISWANTCKAKKHGGAGIKDYTAWNKATIAKLVWAIATKTDTLWVKWVHGRYLRRTDWWDYSPPADCSWTWKKICAIKEIFKAGCYTPHIWTFQGKDCYKVNSGYQWLIGGTKVPWGKVIWARASIPRHAFISWVYVHHRLPTKMRLARFIPRSDIICALCNNADEDDTHLFSECPYATEVWSSLSQWWPLPFYLSGHTLSDLTGTLSSFPAPKAYKQITFAIFAAGIYFIWLARNQLVFNNLRISATQTVKMIKDQIRHRFLFLNNSTCTYARFIDVILR